MTLAAIAARQVGRPVKLVLTRKQMFFTTGHRPRTLQRVALGATPDGKLTSLIHEGTGETSRYEQFIEALTVRLELHVFLPERAHPLPAGAARYRHAQPHARPRRGERHLRARMRHGRAVLRARHRPDRAAPPQRAGDRRRREQAVLQPLADEMLRSWRRALRLVAAGSRAALDARRPAADRHGHGVCDLSRLSQPGERAGAPAAGRHCRGRGGRERHGAGHLHVDDAGRGRMLGAAGGAGPLQPRALGFSARAAARRLADDGLGRVGDPRRLHRGAGGGRQARRRGPALAGLRRRARRRRMARGPPAPPRRCLAGPALSRHRGERRRADRG